MSTQRCAFPERLFEFAFNAEYAETHKAVIVGVPDIPSQDAEKWLGYDVAFEVQRGAGVTGSIALQHKVPRWIGGPGSGQNKHVREVAGPMYFTFPLDTAQFNLIESVSSAKMPGIEFYFCAPLFVAHGDMQTHYSGRQIESKSIFIDVAGVGPLDPAEPHKIVYLQDASAAWVFSEKPRTLTPVRPTLRAADRSVDAGWLSEKLFKIRNGLAHRLDKLPDQDPPGHLAIAAVDDALPEGRPASPHVQSQAAAGTSAPKLRQALLQTAQILANQLNMSWLVEIAE